MEVRFKKTPIDKNVEPIELPPKLVPASYVRCFLRASRREIVGNVYGDGRAARVSEGEIALEGFATDVAEG